jgi:hypothetical protein
VLHTKSRVMRHIMLSVNSHKVPSDSVYNAIHHSRSIDSTWTLNGLFPKDVNDRFCNVGQILVPAGEAQDPLIPFITCSLHPLYGPSSRSCLTTSLSFVPLVKTPGTMIDVLILQPVNSPPYVWAREFITAARCQVRCEKGCIWLTDGT